jgi:FkbM family methyltransferase
MVHHYTLDQMDWPTIMRDANVTPKGVCHVGAHEGQEVPLYQELGFRTIILVEADPNLSAELLKKYQHTNGISVLPFAAGAEPGILAFHRVLRDQQYNSLLEPIDLGNVQKFEVPVWPLGDYITGVTPVNVLVVDTQGSELQVLEGADLASIEMIVIEVGTKAKYDGQPMREDVESYMEAHGWRMVHEWPHGPRAIWFDQVYVKRS